MERSTKWLIVAGVFVSFGIMGGIADKIDGADDSGETKVVPVRVPSETPEPEVKVQVEYRYPEACVQTIALVERVMEKFEDFDNVTSDQLDIISRVRAGIVTQDFNVLNTEETRQRQLSGRTAKTAHIVSLNIEEYRQLHVECLDALEGGEE